MNLILYRHLCIHYGPEYLQKPLQLLFSEHRCASDNIFFARNSAIIATLLLVRLLHRPINHLEFQGIEYYHRVLFCFYDMLKVLRAPCRLHHKMFLYATPLPIHQDAL